MKTRNILVQALTLIIILGLGIIVGRYVLFHTPSAQQQDTGSKISISTSTDSSDPQTTSSTTSKYGFESQQPLQSSAPQTCQSSLAAQIAKDKPEYEKGTIVVSFISTRSFDQSKAEISSYGYRIENESAARTSYATTPVVTVVVPQGSEVNAICIFRSNSHVRYAGLNTTFELHD